MFDIRFKILYKKYSAMKTNIESSRTGTNDWGRQVRPGAEPAQPIINWPALWARILHSGRRIWVAFRYMLGKRTEQLQVNTVWTSDLSVWRRRWQWAQVGIVVVGIYYVTQRDINFSIHLKAPVGGERGWVSPTQEGGGTTTDKFSLAQAVSFIGHDKQAPTAKQVSLSGDRIERYVTRFQRVALTESEKFGIPAAIKMAQAILESQAGESTAARTQNNHFGQAMGNDTYESAWANWRAHSLLLREEYSQLFSLGDDIRSWADGLERVGYSTDSRYAERLMQIIETYKLTEMAETEL